MKWRADEYGIHNIILITEILTKIIERQLFRTKINENIYNIAKENKIRLLYSKSYF